MACVVALFAAGGPCRSETSENSQDVLRDGMDAAAARAQWQAHVRAEQRRVRELAIQRRLRPEVETFVNKERQASERALNDMTLRRGDIVVTDKGAFVFVGNEDEDRMPGDFVPLAVEPKRP